MTKKESLREERWTNDLLKDSGKKKELTFIHIESNFQFIGHIGYAFKTCVSAPICKKHGEEMDVIFKKKQEAFRCFQCKEKLLLDKSSSIL